MEITNTYKKFFNKHYLQKKQNMLSSFLMKVKYIFKQGKKKTIIETKYKKKTNIYDYKFYWELHHKSYYDQTEPWVTATINKRSLYKYIFVRPFNRIRKPSSERKNKFHSLEWNKYVADGGDFPIKEHARKRRLQVQPLIRYYIYLPYFGHISSKHFIKKNKKMRKIMKSSTNYNKQISNVELNMLNLLTRTNFSVNKKNAKFLLNQKSVFLHNSNAYAFSDKKTEGYKDSYKTFNKVFNWKNNYYLLDNRFEPTQKFNVKKKTAISMNNDYRKTNWTYFLSLQNKKYINNGFDINISKNVIYLNRHFFHKNMLHNEKMSPAYWTAISLLRNKIRYNVE